MFGKKHTIESLERMSSALKGRIPSDETRKKMSESGKGKVISDETRKKKSILFKGNKNGMFGKKHTIEARKKMSDKRKTRIYTNETKIKLSETKKGSKNPSWKGGITAEHLLIRTSLKYNKWRKGCFIRDSFTCQKCGSKKLLEVHHIVPFSKLMEEVKNKLSSLNLYDSAVEYEPLWDISNGITLCKSCHKKTKHKKLE
jgi:hypothetical protein